MRTQSKTGGPGPANETASDRSGNRHALAFICLTMALDMAGVGIILPVMPDLIQELGASSIGNAAGLGGWLVFAYAIMQFFFSPIAGALGDQFGRRPVLLVALAGLAIDYFVMALAPTLVLLFISRLIAGIAGATWPVANAYVADISDQKKRARNFGLVSAAGGAGLILGPSIGGLIGEYGVRLPFYAAGILAALNVLYGFFVLPESLQPEGRRAFNIKRANPIGGLIKVSGYKLVPGVLGALFLMQLATQALITIWAYFTLERFDWSKAEIGLSVTFYGILLAVVQGALTGPAVTRFGETKTVLVGLGMGLIAYLIFTVADQGWMMYAGIAVGVFGGFVTPAMQAIMTGKVPANAQGELQGAIASVLAITVIIGPLFMTQLFGYFTTISPIYFPGSPFLASAALMVVSALVFCLVMIKNGPQQDAP